MKDPSSASRRKQGVLKAAWKASNGPKGRFIDPTLYSNEHLARWLPLRFSKTVPILLALIVFLNVTLLAIGIEGALSNWYYSTYGMYALYLVPLPFIAN